LGFSCKDVCKLVNAFYLNQLDVSKLNLATICLILKKQDASLITNYRPISLINYNFKIITKLLADRLAKVCDPFSRASHCRWVLGDGMQKKDTEIPPKRAFV
jgi:hypothetical protein